MKSRPDNEQDKFVECPDGRTAVRVKICNTEDIRVSGDAFYPAGETISAVKAVYEDSGIFLGDPDIFIKSNIIGMSVTSGLAGSQIRVIESGNFFDSSFTFIVGEPVFLGAGGLITQVEPVSIFRVVLGFAVAENGFRINIQEPIEQ
jgi:hypothetical protein